MLQKGISRKKRRSNGDGNKQASWDYHDLKGKLITDKETIERCNKLVIPPAWKDVWISEDSTAYLQATGVDAKGRTQYRYHNEWNRKRAVKKFHGILEFARLLPVIRKKTASDLSLKGMPKDKVSALIIKLMDNYHIRVGNDEYARKNKHYGLTTLKEGHVTFDRTTNAEGELDANFEFMGKSGKLWKTKIWEDDLALLIEASGKVGGNHKNQELFKYEDQSGKDFDIKSYHINEYLDQISAGHHKVTAKEFRTWAATWKTAFRLSGKIDPVTKTARKRVLNEIIKTVASDLGNTPAVCRSSYIHPKIISDWESGKFRKKWNLAGKNKRITGLSKEETHTLYYLQQ